MVLLSEARQSEQQSLSSEAYLVSVKHLFIHARQHEQDYCGHSVA